jgi:hypothetical protein
MKTDLKRPFWNDEIVNDLAQIVGKKVFDWCNADGSDDTELEDCVISARKILKYHSNDNGYELAKEFEDEGFNPDAELVEILDFISHDKHDIQSKHIKNWVKENDLKLDLEVGQKVIAKLQRIGEVECEVMSLYPDHFQYGLWNEKLGYIKGKGHRIVDAENIVSVI